MKAGSLRRAEVPAAPKYANAAEAGTRTPQGTMRARVGQASTEADRRKVERGARNSQLLHLDCSVVRLIPSLALRQSRATITHPDSLTIRGSVAARPRATAGRRPSHVGRSGQRRPEIGQRNLELRAGRKNDGAFDQVLSSRMLPARPIASAPPLWRLEYGDSALQRPRKLSDKVVVPARHVSDVRAAPAP